jgi:hypothetical protein
LLPDAVVKAWRGVFSPNPVERIILGKNRRSKLGKNGASIHPLKSEDIENEIDESMI